MDVRNPSITTEAVLQAAFNAEDVEYFEQFFNNCGENELALIQKFTQQAASLAWTKQQKLFSTAGKYEDMMIAGLKRLVDLSNVITGLRSGGLDIKLCLKVINNFYSSSNIKYILTYQRNNLDFPTFLYFLNCLELNPPLCSYKKIDKAIKALEEEYFAKERAEAIEIFQREYPTWVSMLVSGGAVNVLRHKFAFRGNKGAVELFERSLNFCSLQKVESMFVGVDLGQYYWDDLSSMSLLRFKFLWKKEASHLERTCWIALCSNRIDIAKFLLKGNSLNWVQTIQLADNIQLIGPDGMGRRLEIFFYFYAIQRIVENKFIDLKGLKELSLYLSDQPNLKSSADYIEAQISRLERQAAATTLLGMRSFGLLPAATRACLDRGVVGMIARMVNVAEWPSSKPASTPALSPPK